MKKILIALLIASGLHAQTPFRSYITFDSTIVYGTGTNTPVLFAGSKKEFRRAWVEVENFPSAPKLSLQVNDDGTANANIYSSISAISKTRDSVYAQVFATAKGSAGFGGRRPSGSAYSLFQDSYYDSTVFYIGGARAMKIGSDGLSIGPTIGDITAQLQVSKSWGSGSPSNLIGGFTSYGDLSRFVLRRAEGTFSAPTQILSGQDIGNLGWRGYHSGGSFASTNTAAVTALAVENFTPTAHGTELRFATTPIGTTSAQNRVTIAANGYTGFGTTTGIDEMVTVAGNILFGTQTNKAKLTYTTNTARTFTLPNVTGNRTFAFIDEANVFSVAGNTFRNNVKLSGGDVGVGTITWNTESQDNYTWTFPDQTGTIALTAVANNISWTAVNKTGSSLGDLVTRSAADLSSGTLADTRLSSNVPLKNAANTFTANQTITATQGAATLLLKGEGGPVFAGIEDDGASAYLFRAGYYQTLPSATGTIALLNGGQTWAATTLQTNFNADKWDGLDAPANATGFLYNNGSGSLSWAAGTGAVTSVFGRTGAVVAATNDYTWAQINKGTSSLADITTRSAADLSSGTLADARLSSNVPLKNAANVFSVAGNTFRDNIKLSSSDVGLGTITWNIDSQDNYTWTFPSQTGTVNVTASSRRFKQNITDLVDGLSLVRALKPRTFDYRPEYGNRSAYGLIAEEVEQIDPRLVMYANKLPTGVHYTELTAVLLRAIQQLEQRVKTLEAKN